MIIYPFSYFNKYDSDKLYATLSFSPITARRLNWRTRQGLYFPCHHQRIFLVIQNIETGT